MKTLFISFALIFSFTLFAQEKKDPEGTIPANLTEKIGYESDYWNLNKFTINWSFPNNLSFNIEDVINRQYYKMFICYLSEPGNLAEIDQSKIIDLKYTYVNQEKMNKYFSCNKGTAFVIKIEKKFIYANDKWGEIHYYNLVYVDDYIHNKEGEIIGTKLKITCPYYEDKIKVY